MGVYVHRYVLRSRGALNAVSQRKEFHGALLRWEEGVGCLHPWPEFGDEPVEKQLELLRQGGTSGVINRALRMAEVDGRARRAGVSLFAGLEVPECHYSWDQNQSLEGQVQRVLEEGWKAVKTKGGSSVDAVLKWLEDFGARAGAVKVRVDFNACLEERQFQDLLSWMPRETLRGLDFVEDPFAYDPPRWQAVRRAHAVRLALDKGLRGAAGGFDVAVLKPGRRDWRTAVEAVPREVKLVLTSAMDHAIGQSFAAWEAALARKELGERVDLCGLCTEHLFEKDAFFERLSSFGGRLAVDRRGAGLGFDEVIETLPWKRL